jgi:anti-anti-sigma regulatory factor
MTLKIDKYSDGSSTTLRLAGRMCGEHLEELKAQIKNSGPKVTLDLNEVTLVDVDIVRFLGNCRREGVELLNCAPYIGNWIEKEQDTEG